MTTLEDQALLKTNSSTIRVEKIDTIKALGDIQRDWNALLEQNQTKTVELSYEWQVTYWKHFNENSELFILIIKENEAVVAIAPLKLSNKERFGFKVRTLEFIAASESNYQDFIYESNRIEILQQFADYLVIHQNIWDSLYLENIPENSPTVNFLRRHGNNNYLLRTDRTDKCVVLEIDKTWDEYFKSLSRNAKSKIKKSIRRLENIRTFEYFHCSNEEDFSFYLKHLFNLHRKRWNQTQTPSQFNNDKHCNFYLETVPKLFHERKIDLFVLKSGEACLALLYSFECDKVYLLQLLAHDVDYAQCSPSIVMHHFLIKEAFAKGLKIFDFGHDYPYKNIWSKSFRNKVSIEIYQRNCFKGWFLYVSKTSFSILRSELQKIPFLGKIVRYFRAKLFIIKEASLKTKCES
jgi:CelD/BcsL family acetyltransferase involved in cellulose biosynthesis